MNPYVGDDSQLFGVEEHRLVGGKGDGMRLFEVWNGHGLAFTVSADRCADITRLSHRGINCSFISPAGYVHPAYFDEPGLGFLKSMTAGFLTTCGLSNVGVPCRDDGEHGLHGTVSNTPAGHVNVEIGEREITLKTRVNPGRLFGPKLVLEREIGCSLEENRLEIRDKIINEGGEREALLLLYHMNLGYPLLSPDARLVIETSDTQPRDARAAEDLDTWQKILEPQAGFAEQCYYHKPLGRARLENPKAGLGLEIGFDPQELGCLTQWKQMGVRDYVLGLEPGTCYPDGRAVTRQKGLLQWLEPGESYRAALSVRTFDA